MIKRIFPYKTILSLLSEDSISPLDFKMPLLRKATTKLKIIVKAIKPRKMLPNWKNHGTDELS